MKEIFEIFLLMIFEYLNIPYVYRYSLQSSVPNFLINYCNQLKNIF